MFSSPYITHTEIANHPLADGANVGHSLTLDLEKSEAMIVQLVKLGHLDKAMVQYAYHLNSEVAQSEAAGEDMDSEAYYMAQESLLEIMDEALGEALAFEDFANLNLL
jgi:hypothetical protein